MVYLGQFSLPSATVNQWKAFVHVGAKGVGVEEAGLDGRVGAEEEGVEGAEVAMAAKSWGASLMGTGLRCVLTAKVP